jgi:hypothetical protein
LLVDPGIVPAGLVPVDGDELGDAEDDVAEVVDVVAVDPDPPAEASATPVTPAPTPAATMPVMMSRRARPPDLESIGFLPSRRPPASRGRLAFTAQGASHDCPGPEILLSAHYEPGCKRHGCHAAADTAAARCQPRRCAAAGRAD